MNEPCEYCEGTGEVGPFGWEYPEYAPCKACRGTGVADTGEYADIVYDRMRDESL